MTGDAEKECPRCGETWPATAEFWYRHRRSKDGWASACKRCHRDYEGGPPRRIFGYRPSFEEAALAVSSWFERWEKAEWTEQECLTEVLVLLREILADGEPR